MQGGFAGQQIVALLHTGTDTGAAYLRTHARVVLEIEIIVGEVHAKVGSTHAQQHGQRQPPHEPLLPYAEHYRRQARKRRLRQRNLAAII